MAPSRSPETRGLSHLAVAGYRSLALIVAATEGGLPAVFWAGPQRSREPARLRLGFAGASSAPASFSICAVAKAERGKSADNR